MGLDMLLEILRSLESLATEITLVRLQRYMHPDVGGDMVALDGGGVTGPPVASQVQVVGALATNMAFTDVFLFLQNAVSTMRNHLDFWGNRPGLRRELQR